MRKLVILFALSQVLSAAVALASSTPVSKLEPVTVRATSQSGNLMPSIGNAHRTIDTTFEVSVLSGGCTSAGDFRVAVEQRQDFQIVTFVRVKQDTCERPAGPEVLTLRSEKLVAKKPVVVRNPLLVEQRFVY